MNYSVLNYGRISLIGLWSLLLSLSACGHNVENKRIKPMETKNELSNMTVNVHKTTDTATFGAGCFWCVEAVFQQLKGVKSVESGYSGGTTDNPTYKEVCTGETGHAEVTQIIYDPNVISFPELLEAFWGSHDPTTLNRQGADQGTQYRSVIFYHDQEQKELAEKYKKELDASGAFRAAIVTEIAPFSKFYKAEDYHQNYYNLNGDAPYCQFVIAPKLEKFKKVFKDRIK
ncbi:peptide-methionine (S)-S-oxide reductase [Solitalea longa]|uniref:Peptide methionine sulfoxide reductase MsrA n=1 Tax=Solitalea longa TaxID=2079460 RepID=A0A2S5A5E6_9SPHI|nr:peptide-methionine (S)-S-oxide reductase MsrA [Solitalea longa]POY37507.1 peptide-methionine (S)-S-oxide reductase [Solitalea longa]